MRWFKLYANLKDHPKRWRFEEIAGTEHGLHYLTLWFSYVCLYATDGNVTNFTPREVARACEWKGEPQALWDALMGAGFIDKVENSLHAHDWAQENARFIEENSKRKPTGNPRVTHEKPLLEEKRIEEKKKEEKEPSGFVLFWNLYSKKTTKAESLDYWTRKLKPDLELQGSILAGLTLENQARAAAEAKGTFFPAPADPIRWLKKHRWEDLHSAAPAPGQPSAACQHPHDKANWERTFKDGMQIGHCGLCGRPVNRMVEPPKRDEE